MSVIPAELQYTKEHEWVAPTEVESTKSVSEIFAPLTGTVVAINETLSATPELINSDPYGLGWLVEIEVGAEPAGLLSAAQYGAITA